MSANHSQAAYRGQPPASWETISLLAANPGIINFDILLKGGGIISYLGLDTIFLSDLNLEMWSDRLGTRGGEEEEKEEEGLARRGYGSPGLATNRARGIRVIQKEDKLETQGQGEPVGGSAQGSIRLTSSPIGGSHHRVLWEKRL